MSSHIYNAAYTNKFQYFKQFRSQLLKNAKIGTIIGIVAVLFRYNKLRKRNQTDQTVISYFLQYPKFLCILGGSYQIIDILFKKNKKFKQNYYSPFIFSFCTFFCG